VIYDWIKYALEKQEQSECSRGSGRVGNRCHDPATGEFTSAGRAGTAQGAEASQHRSEERKSSTKEREISRRRDQGYGVESSALGESVYKAASDKINALGALRPGDTAGVHAVLDSVYDGMGIGRVFHWSQDELYHTPAYQNLLDRVRAGNLSKDEIISEFFSAALDKTGAVPAAERDALKQAADEYNEECLQNGISVASVKASYNYTQGYVGPADIQIYEQIASAVVGGLTYKGTPYSTLWAINLAKTGGSAQAGRIQNIAHEYRIEAAVVKELFGMFAVEERTDALIADDSEVESYKKDVSGWLAKYAPDGDSQIIAEETEMFIRGLRRGKSLVLLGVTALAAVLDHKIASEGDDLTLATEQQLESAAQTRETIGRISASTPDDIPLGSPANKAILEAALAEAEPGDREELSESGGINTTFWLTTADGSRALCKLNAQHGTAYAEEAAYDIDQVLGFNIVPPTANLGGEFAHKHGSFQGVSLQTDVNRLGFPDNFDIADAMPAVSTNAFLDSEDSGWLHRILALDAIMLNADRHGGNIMLTEKGRVVAIDNGGMYYGTFRATSFGYPLHQQPIADDVYEKLKNVNVSAFRRTLLRHGFYGNEIDERVSRLRRLVQEGVFDLY